MDIYIDSKIYTIETEARSLQYSSCSPCMRWDDWRFCICRCMHGENNNRLSATVGECYWVLQLESATSSTLRKMTAFIARVKWTSIYCKGEVNQYISQGWSAPVFIARVKWTSIYCKGEVNQYLSQGWTSIYCKGEVNQYLSQGWSELVFIARVKWTSIYRKGEVN